MAFKNFKIFETKVDDEDVVDYDEYYTSTLLFILCESIIKIIPSLAKN